MIPFEQWLLDNYGFDGDGITPLAQRAPLFITSDGTFDLRAYEHWRNERRVEFYNIKT